MDAKHFMIEGKLSVVGEMFEGGHETLWRFELVDPYSGVMKTR